MEAGRRMTQQPPAKPAWPGLMIVLSAPSGAGKGAIRQRLQERMPGLLYAVSVTTRPKRPGEVDGVNYHFVTPEEFQARVAAGEFVEWARVYGNYYGTPREPMETWLREGRDVICEKDVQGALSLMDIYPDAVYIFTMPPSLEELRRRIGAPGRPKPGGSGWPAPTTRWPAWTATTTWWSTTTWSARWRTSWPSSGRRSCAPAAAGTWWSGCGRAAAWAASRQAAACARPGRSPMGRGGGSAWIAPSVGRGRG